MSGLTASKCPSCKIILLRPLLQGSKVAVSNSSCTTRGSSMWEPVLPKEGLRHSCHPPHLHNSALIAHSPPSSHHLCSRYWSCQLFPWLFGWARVSTGYNTCSHSVWSNEPPTQPALDSTEDVPIKKPQLQRQQRPPYLPPNQVGLYNLWRVQC